MVDVTENSLDNGGNVVARVAQVLDLGSVVILDNENNDYTGTPVDDVIIGGSGNDTIRGAAGNDIITGLGGRNILVGDSGNDTLAGGGISVRDNNSIRISSDTNGLDYLYGGEARDTFVLGGQPDQGQGTEAIAFYDQRGNNDYAVIADFSASDDRIILGGASTDHSLGASPNGLPQGTGIFKGGELIAIVQGDTDLNINARYFEFS
ncbi:MAG: calcium-binding protein [Xenococcaceae cyanobacterium]